MSKALQLVVAIAAMGLAGGEALAQEVRACPGTKEAQCIEFLVRYYADRKVELFDPEKKVRLESCELSSGKCRDFGPQLDMRSVELLQFRGNSHCYRVCSGGYCYDRCPVH